ncbi:MAG TPA: transglycosylase SLT domain-containing protein [Bacteroidota bacterium]|nr:transglycosylase SLT domain-containing protein [Bacteroidota bacterium]
MISTVSCLTPSQYNYLRSPSSLTSADITVPSRLVDEALPVEMRDLNQRFIQTYAEQLNLDYRLILAIIKHESQFDASAVSYRGATGLMQLMPVTNLEIATKLEIDETLHPESNLKMGMYYFAQLLQLFKASTLSDRIRLSLAAYNAGPGRIYDAQEIAAFLGEHPNRWSSIEKALPLLSKRYSSLHSMVWSAGKPRNGYFGSQRQTLSYVESVTQTYRAYCETIN